MKQKPLTARQLLRLAVDEEYDFDYQAAEACGIRPQDFGWILSGKLNPSYERKVAIAKRFKSVPVSAWGGKP